MDHFVLPLVVNILLSSRLYTLLVELTLVMSPPVRLPAVHGEGPVLYTTCRRLAIYIYATIIHQSGVKYPPTLR